MESLLERLQIKPDEWDWLLIGDGSGSNWNTSAGWGVISVCRRTGNREAWWGGMSKGTVNLAEMLAYIQPLSWIAAERKRLKQKSFIRVHIITDSQYCQGQGDKGQAALSPKANGALWRIFDDFERRGIILTWHWLEREACELNLLADAISKQARQQYVPAEKGQTSAVLTKAHAAASGLPENKLTAYNPSEPENPDKPPRRKKRRKKARTP